MCNKAPPKPSLIMQMKLSEGKKGKRQRWELKTRTNSTVCSDSYGFWKRGLLRGNRGTEGLGVRGSGQGLAATE